MIIYYWYMCNFSCEQHFLNYCQDALPVLFVLLQKVSLCDFDVLLMDSVFIAATFRQLLEAAESKHRRLLSL